MRIAPKRVSTAVIHFCPVHHQPMSNRPDRPGVFECLVDFETDKPCRWRWQAGAGFYKWCGCGRKH